LQEVFFEGCPQMHLQLFIMKQAKLVAYHCVVWSGPQRFWWDVDPNHQTNKQTTKNRQNSQPS
jgi:hypothetical protein